MGEAGANRQVRVLLYCDVPFSLAHGGAQVQIQQTKAGLEALGVRVEYLRWWDDRQHGDLIHAFGVTGSDLIRLAAAADIPVVLTSLLTAACNYSGARLLANRLSTRMLRPLLDRVGIGRQLQWSAFHECAQNVVGLRAEQQVLEGVHGVPTDRIAIVPLGLSTPYLNASAGSRSQQYLICTGTITPRKRTVELAQLARQARVPVLFVGKPYSEKDPYWLRFRSLIDGEHVQHHPHVESEQQMIGLLQEARGFVLLSRYENWCLSAHEAIACGLPVLVPDQNWSRERFGMRVRYWPHGGTATADALREFYEACPELAAPRVRLYGWQEVAGELKRVYRRALDPIREPEPDDFLGNLDNGV
jgi:glycosyltransferase involved in cell wall biosynthesis